MDINKIKRTGERILVKVITKVSKVLEDDTNKKIQNDNSNCRIISNEQSQGFIRHFLKGNNYLEGSMFANCSAKKEDEKVEIIDFSFSPLLLQALENRENFADRMKAKNNQVVEQRLNPDIEEWKERQKQIIIGMKDEVLEHFEWAASIGQLTEGFWSIEEFTCWGEESSNIPNAEAITNELVKEVLKPYGIKVEQVLLKRGGDEISVTCRIE